ncbi:MAG: hypothetical protein AYK22_05960 [Thermoplasmatales archaeon SG8-52-3]|nr:MAG: hypothetical protein AYK22_05960 [Thermoplasmatales archaeon SG8-52-3]
MTTRRIIIIPMDSINVGYPFAYSYNTHTLAKNAKSPIVICALDLSCMSFESSFFYIKLFKRYENMKLSLERKYSSKIFSI